MRGISILLSKQNPLGLLENPDAGKLNYWLSCFIVEVRCKNGEPYPAWTLYLLAGLLHYIGWSKSKLTPNLIDKNDPCFQELSGTCDSVAQHLYKDGVVASVKHAAIVTPDKHSGLL